MKPRIERIEPPPAASTCTERQINHNCRICGTAFISRHPRHFYCERCSESQDLKRKRLASIRTNQGRRRDERRDTGLAISKREARDLANYYQAPVLKWQVRIFFPFSWTLSKNAIYTLVPKGHVALRREVRQQRSALALKLKADLRGRKIMQNKLWLDLFIEKPSHKGDAINVLDTLCDAIKVATGVDDRWFCIRHLDWAIQKDDPQIIIGIGQEDVTDAQACSYCGRILPLERFGLNRANKAGRSRICQDCSKIPTELMSQLPLKLFSP